MRPPTRWRRVAITLGAGLGVSRPPWEDRITLVFPFLVVDAILGWMLWHGWREHEVLGTRMNRKGQDRSAFWLSFARLAALLALSLVGTIAALHGA